MSKKRVLNEEIQEKLFTYSRATSGLFERMLKYARVNTDIDPNDYESMRDLVQRVYLNHNLGLDLMKQIRENYEIEVILKTIEKDYKKNALIYKEALPRALRIKFTNLLESDFSGNAFLDQEENQKFKKLLEDSGPHIFNEIFMKAFGGDVHYQILLGKCYFLGWGTDVNIVDGKRWLEYATESGDKDAYFYHGVAQETIQEKLAGSRRNPRAVDDYIIAYEAGSAEAAYALYLYYLSHSNEPNSCEKAHAWLRRGVDRGCAYCNYILGIPPKTNWTTLNEQNALDFVKAAASFGEPKAYELLADIYGKGHAGQSKDKYREEECLQLVEKLAVR